MNSLEKNTDGLTGRINNDFGLGIKQPVLEMPNAFSNMCTRLVTVIAQGKIIQERTLLDFSRFVVFTIRNSITRQPDSFHELSTRISDYWHYELDSDTNSDKKYSYIRLYQMIDTINEFYAEQDVQNKVIRALDKQRRNENVVRLIQQYPGITYGKLLSMESVLPETLKNQLEELESDGFLYGRHSGNERYYILTNAGDVLFEALVASQKNPLDGEWSDNRTKILIFLLERSENRSIKKSSVLRLVQILAQCDDKTADEFWTQIWNRYTHDVTWNTLGLTEHESFLFSKERFRISNIPNIYKLISLPWIESKDIKMPLHRNSQEHQKRMDIYNYIE